MVREGYRGISILVQINRDWFFTVAYITLALASGIGISGAVLSY